MNKLTLSKVCIAFGCLLFGNLGLRAQGNASENSSLLSFGVKGGATVSGFTNNYEICTQKKTGFTLGGFGEIRPIPMVGIEAGMYYAREGALGVNPLTVYPITEVYLSYFAKLKSDIVMHSLQIPILFNFHPISGAIGPKITVGWEFDFLLKATSVNYLYQYTNQNNTAYYLPMEKQTESDVTSSLKRFNTGPVIGLGIDFQSSSLFYSLDFRYKIGLNKINNLGYYREQTNYYDDPLYNISLNTLTVTLGIGIKK
jgi:hypothetical protein